jgi:2-polyprenyl-3-methyl-5-hydroxy-6-metoxy-1,4-benzoquinol methylase
MTTVLYSQQYDVESRARKSLGTSNATIYAMVVHALTKYGVSGEVLADVGCGTGNLKPFVSDRFSRYIGIDVVRHNGFPADAEFHRVNLDTGKSSLADCSVDAVVSIETIEHLENPRQFMRELVRIVKPGGWIIITTPNQLSFLSLLTLIVKHEFAAFQNMDYPAHITALLEIDLKRIAVECGLRDIHFAYSYQGRVILTPWSYPKFLSHLFPRTFSDNLLLIANRSTEQKCC